jgi:2,5-diketo-D-gluconate reductase B
MSQQSLPALGLGTSGLSGEECTRTVEAALDLGYRHVDTAQMYDNEAAVAAGIERSGVDREDLFLATKVHPGNLTPGDVRESTEASLGALGVDRVDLLYVHWPMGAYDAAETLPAFDDLRADGLTRHVGLSNFTPALLDEASEVLDAPVFAHQVECHPLLPQRDLRERAAADGHHLVGYSPLARGAILDHPVLGEVADDHDASPAQVALAWALAREVAPIPKARGDHLPENLAALDLALDDDALDRIDAIEERERTIDPQGAPWS